jgi:hypothetical protein
MSLYDELTADLAEIFSTNDFGKPAVFIANSGTLPTSLTGINFWNRSHLGITTNSLSRVTQWADSGGLGVPFNQVAEAPTALPAYEFSGSDIAKSLRFKAPTGGGNSPSISGGVGGFSNALTMFLVLRADALLDLGVFFGAHWDTNLGGYTFLDPFGFSYVFWFNGTDQKLVFSISVGGNLFNFNGDNGTFLDSPIVRLITLRWESGGNGIIRVNQTQTSSSGGVIGTLATDAPPFRLGSLGDEDFQAQFQWFDLFDILGYSVALSDANVVAVENFLLANSTGYKSAINIHFVNEFEAALLDPVNAESSKPFALCKTSDVSTANHNSHLIVDYVTYHVVGVQPYTSHITKLILSKDAD